MKLSSLIGELEGRYEDFGEMEVLDVDLWKLFMRTINLKCGCVKGIRIFKPF